MIFTGTTSFPLGLFCNATLSGPLPEVKPRSSSPVRQPHVAPTEPITDEEANELIHDLCPDEKST